MDRRPPDRPEAEPEALDWAINGHSRPQWSWQKHSGEVDQSQPLSRGATGLAPTPVWQ